MKFATFEKLEKKIAFIDRVDRWDGIFIYVDGEEYRIKLSSFDWDDEEED